jgi:hypothetical protein
MTAAGVRIQPSTSPDQLRALAATRSGWQSQAWAYRDLIPELRGALKFRANNISRVKFYVAQVNPDPDDDEPIALSLRNSDSEEKRKRVTVSPALAAAAEAELARLPLENGAFLSRWSENQDVAGECWLHGFVDQETGEESWKIRSTSEIEVSPDARSVILKDPALLGAQRQLDLGRPGNNGQIIPGTEELYRLWVEHPQYSHQADSACLAMLNVLEDVVLIGRELRAVSRSRIMSNGILKVPRGLTLPINTREDTDEGDDEKFSRDLQYALVVPISNEGDAGGVSPVMVTGDLKDLEGLEHIRLEREDSPQLLEKQSAALSRMGNGLDIPPEVVTGLADVNHWTAWQIDISTARNYIEPGVRLMVDSLTFAFLRAGLRAQGFSLEEIRQLVVWYDISPVTENPNRRQDAIDARKTGDIGPAAFRKALGFNDEDAPTPEEMLWMVAMTSGMDQSAAMAIMTWFARREADGNLDLPDLSALPGVKVPAAIGSGPEADATPPAGPGDAPGTAPGGGAGESAPTNGTPGQPAFAGLSGQPSPTVHTGLTAAAAPPMPDYRLALDEARRLMETDRAIRDQVLQAAEAALQRALEKAGSRLRSKATANRELSLTLRGQDPLTVLRMVGRQQAFALGGTDEHLLAEAFRELEDKFVALVTAGISAIVDRVLKMLGLKRDSRRGGAAAKRMTERMSKRIDEGWAHLHATLQDRARELMFSDGDPETEEGELVDGAVPHYAVRRALAVVGGLPESSGGLDDLGRSVTGEPVGGLANGDTVTREMEEAGAVELGYLWVYGITPQKRKFDPHWDLEAERFASWTDPKLDTLTVYNGRFAWVGPYFRPGDHGGCMCDYVPAYAIPEYADQVDERLRVPTEQMAQLLKLAAEDDAAGRTDTTAQHERDRWQHIQKLQARFIKGGAA